MDWNESRQDLLPLRSPLRPDGRISCRSSQPEVNGTYFGHTLRDWEQNRCVPDAPARALLRAIEREPETIRRLLGQAA